MCRPGGCFALCGTLADLQSPGPQHGGDSFGEQGELSADWSAGPVVSWGSGGPALGCKLACSIPVPKGSGDAREEKGSNNYKNLPMGCMPEGADAALQDLPSPGVDSSKALEDSHLCSRRL